MKLHYPRNKDLRIAINGFSVTELLVVVLILGVLLTVGIRTSDAAWRREQANAAAVELAGWLEAVRRLAIRGQSCEVDIEATGTTLSGGADLATAAELTGGPTSTQAIANQCLPDNLPARVPSLPANNTFTVTASPPSFTFTPRGTVVPVPTTDNQLETRITLNPSGPGRCVRVRGMLGYVDIGRLESGSCTYGGRF